MGNWSIKPRGPEQAHRNTSLLNFARSAPNGIHKSTVTTTPSLCAYVKGLRSQCVYQHCYLETGHAVTDTAIISAATARAAMSTFSSLICICLRTQPILRSPKLRPLSLISLSVGLGKVLSICESCLHTLSSNDLPLWPDLHRLVESTARLIARWRQSRDRSC